MQAMAVTWRRKGFAMPFLVDVDSVDQAAEIAIRLNYQPSVFEVKVSTLEYDPDPEVTEAVRKRIEQRMNAEWAAKALTE